MYSISFGKKLISLSVSIVKFHFVVTFSRVGESWVKREEEMLDVSVKYHLSAFHSFLLSQSYIFGNILSAFIKYLILQNGKKKEKKQKSKI